MPSAFPSYRRTALVQANPRIEARVGNIYHGAEDYDEEGGKHGDRHDGRDVEGADGVCGVLTYAAQIEHGLRQDRPAADYRREVKAPERDHRNEGAAQHVPQEHPSLGKAFRVRSSDE